ncbi:hypothetical protein [uncultured Fluviicola sp.]|uniref:hypothetical protein n=1 Tax=uncultured Fluviicola sp. TaxID=463303 RepID=UPI0025E4F24E|nr:hypothetical protein [uncultured Fluviicola sp.]
MLIFFGAKIGYNYELRVPNHCCPVKFPTPLIILFVSLLFAQAEKVGKTAFAQLQLSANQSIRINSRKGGIRIQNAIL